ncbi:protein of unknown function DUF6 transmembrane [Isosphaera pallida ATCC 43644]|uniref:EamA domain-containing protein n=1 Tax=Isosphaera pallida (strain ATCC 43644 / DSM 9630 / IS1B) TaxID=575540 RepID=E8QXU4_ISOPI|nr:DMT family transporter [Isosphaera pallida]ADV64131.1 protein of unknown function DUF6 transmembrane [Isosphaera pallida ATCC 43644]
MEIGPSPASRSKPLDAAGLGAAVLCCAIWGGNAVAVKFTVPDVPPLACAGWRFLLALPILVAVCRWTGRPLAVPRAAWGVMAIHVALTIVQIGSFNWGTALGQAGRSSVFINVHPLVVAPLAWLWLGERMTGRGLAGLIAAALGVAVLVSEPILRGGGSLTGDLIVLASGIVFGCQTVFQKKTFHRIPAPTMLLWQTIGAMPFFLALSWLIDGTVVERYSHQAMLGILYQGIMVSGFCFTVWMILLNRHPAGQLATLAFLTPLFGITFGCLARGEPFTWPLGLGAALVGLGIHLTASGSASARRGASWEDRSN